MSNRVSPIWTKWTGPYKMEDFPPFTEGGRGVKPPNFSFQLFFNRAVVFKRLKFNPTGPLQLCLWLAGIIYPNCMAWFNLVLHIVHLRSKSQLKYQKMSFRRRLKLVFLWYSFYKCPLKKFWKDWQPWSPTKTVFGQKHRCAIFKGIAFSDFFSITQMRL